MRSRSFSTPRHCHLAGTNNAHRLATRVCSNSAKNSREQSPIIQTSAKTDSVQPPASTLSATRNFLLPCLRSVPRLLRWLLLVQSSPVSMMIFDISTPDFPSRISFPQFFLFNLTLTLPLTEVTFLSSFIMPISCWNTYPTLFLPLTTDS